MIHPPTGEFANRTFHFPVRVYYEDTDFSGIVYHANYLRYFERGRSTFLRLVGIPHIQIMEQDGVAWAVRRMEIDFIKPARIEDRLTVHTAYTELTGARMSGAQVIRRDGEDLVRATVMAACVTKDGRATRIPAWVREALRAYVAPLR